MTLPIVRFLVVLTTAVATAGITLPDLVPAQFVLANSARVGVSRSWLPTLAMLKFAGAGGLIVGLLGLRYIGIAAATGLVLYFIGAVIVHVRARVFSNIAFPGGYLVLSIASLVLLVAH
ncbi:membrane protein [Mycobacterium kubicae]|uniref:DoxX family protein n=1 Tax=Mycobacterium kubicae TaxID=120959 RepID=A0AAX1J326_9MYCO|nr:DoxX family protein [Mycobacterium kubicae]MCV7098154.1 DoxX family protein [Mycobacterium kubicae]OBF17489.1 hypothetical protein A5725_23365 [Mycobacterium kubicae]OBK47482.1 hypothetical protein A5657_24410 [Mycobacterium kubicae]ORW03542.1 hypothetical protein AWC13_01990 [Mycobacterium kubicae]QNI07335.1 DoxX family protein [Mycobacterium kubicae]